MGCRLVIVGGGFSGACLAVQLVRGSVRPLAITIIDPAERVGRGLAYGAVDPDHRLNAPTFSHSLLPEDAWHLSRWCLEQGILQQDPQAMRPDGAAYIRRSDYGRYLEQTLRDHAHWPATGSTIRHCRDTAVALGLPGEPLAVQTAAGDCLPADQVFVATGNPLPRLQPPFPPALAGHPRIIENPLDTARLSGIDPQARVLLVGAGLTSLDVLSTLLRCDHRGPVEVVSRRGLRPRSQAPVAPVLARAQSLQAIAAMPAAMALDRVHGLPAAWLSAAATPPDVRRWLRALRLRIREVQAGGGAWYQAFDDIRDSVWQLWPTLPVTQQRRFIARLRTWYDVHRFRAPPQNEEMVEAACKQGRVHFLAARLRAVTVSPDGEAIEVTMRRRGDGDDVTETYDAVINCTGLDPVAGLAGNPFLDSLVQGGWIRRDPCGLGFEADAACRAVGRDGVARAMLRLVGPPTVGSFGDPIGAVFISLQIHRMLAEVFGEMAGGG